ncbi:MAG: deoxyguanosinetriphosphate triphosphohydrolase [Synergistaceae bacterium]|jgi:dGTPase|nr:deoxyguanosinetriphosphate triphosphohydrolase [Synergistaceae bacterium]
MSLREVWEKRELEWFAPWACASARSRGREREEKLCPLRTAFQRDRDRIIHSKSFRRLKHKTQVLSLPESDHTRTRLTHTLEVAQIARTISRALRLNEDLTEAIALAHDLGHTPFGHTGERALRELAISHGLHGFHHAEQSLRVVDVLERDGSGLNLTWEVRMGIIQHSKGQIDVRDGFNLTSPSTVEAWVVRVSDSIAYLNHDLDDALGADFLRMEDIPGGIIDVLGASHGARIDSLVRDVVANSDSGRVEFSGPFLEQIENLRNFLYVSVYSHESIKKEEPKVARVIGTLFEHALGGGKMSSLDAVDWISGMTDRYALQLFREIAEPDSPEKNGIILAPHALRGQDYSW